MNKVKLKQIDTLLKVLVGMLLEDLLLQEVNWSGANQEICSRWLQKIGYLKVVDNEYYINEDFNLFKDNEEAK